MARTPAQQKAVDFLELQGFTVQPPDDQGTGAVYLEKRRPDNPYIPRVRVDPDGAMVGEISGLRHPV